MLVVDGYVGGAYWDILKVILADGAGRDAEQRTEHMRIILVQAQECGVFASEIVI